MYGNSMYADSNLFPKLGSKKARTKRLIQKFLRYFQAIRT